MRPLRWAVIGVGGYGRIHMDRVRAMTRQGQVELCAAAEIAQDAHKDLLAELRQAGVRVYNDYAEMLRAERPDVTSVPTPIHLHLPMALAAFEQGSNVMLEKPPAVLVQHVDRMTAEASRRGLACQVGFQNVADAAARELKERLAAGEIGGIRELVVRGYWRRTDNYYRRAPWAGRTRLGGEWVLDGPLNNPLIHYVHEALFLAAGDMDETARPVAVQAELYRAHPIEGEDTVCARARLDGGALLCCYLTLCAAESSEPTVEIVGEAGRAAWRRGHYAIEGRSGRNERDGGRGDLFMNLIRHLRGEEPLWSPVRAARNVILHNNGCFLSSGGVHAVPDRHVRRIPAPDGDVATEVEGLIGLLEEAAAGRRLLSECGGGWAGGSREVALDFERFDPSPLFGG